MKCQSGNHEWSDKFSAVRCCSPEWRRDLRFYAGPNADTSGLEIEGRSYVHGEIMVKGWVRIAFVAIVVGDEGAETVIVGVGDTEDAAWTDAAAVGNPHGNPVDTREGLIEQGHRAVPIGREVYERIRAGEIYGLTNAGTFREAVAA